ncbi:MAG: hypothetical protein JNJ69_04420 [Leptospiraceae bacterium]|nr:hypothetical protein [Leptospiraceae bacterium]
MRGLKHRGLRALIIFLIIAGVVTFWVLRPIKETDFSTPGFTPVRDDALAQNLAPIIIGDEKYGSPTRLLYRMARSATGDTYIAYHPFYPDEENPHSGFGALMSRLIYTGGLHLKDIMFGRADIELIEVVVGKAGKPELLAYEDAENYNPRAFSVKHLPKSVKNPVQPFCFSTPTWNHMFALADAKLCTGKKPLKAEYFTEAEWNQYRMVKKTEAILRRNRMHRVYERVSAP